MQDSDLFVSGCSDARKAWHRTNLLSITNPAIAGRVKKSLMDCNATEITDLLLEIMGPVAPVDIRDAMGSSSVGHRKLAGLVFSLSMRVGVAKRVTGQMVDLEEIKAMLIKWIDVGNFGTFKAGEIGEAESSQAQKISALFNTEKHPGRIRLAIAAPLAPALESLIVISLLSDAVLSMMTQTARQVSTLQADRDKLTGMKPGNSAKQKNNHFRRVNPSDAFKQEAGRSK